MLVLCQMCALKSTEELKQNEHLSSWWSIFEQLPSGITWKWLPHTLKNFIIQEDLPLTDEWYIWSFAYNDLETLGGKDLYHSSVWYTSSIYSKLQLLMLQIGSKSVSSLFQIDEALKPQVLENYLKENSALIHFVCRMN